MIISPPTPPSTPPRDIADLRQRARAIAGHTLAELAAGADLTLPDDPVRGKGLVGQLLERWLGASAGNRALPDFTHLGIELKTLPVDSDGKPTQSTYVTKVPLTDLETFEWRASTVYRKLRHVMWVLIQSQRAIPLAQRIVGQAFFWQPDAAEEQLLRADWEFHMARVRAGEVNEITGKDGAVLQVRPKARSASDDVVAELPGGCAVVTRPCGFYLRPAFTGYLVQRYFYGRDVTPAMK